MNEKVVKAALQAVKNISSGPVTTIVGFALLIFGGYMVYATYETKENEVTWASVEVGIFLLGVGLLVLPDPADETNTKDEKNDETKA